MNHLTPDERADLQAAAACDWPVLLRFVTEPGSWKATLGHDGTVRWEAEA